MSVDELPIATRLSHVHPSATVAIAQRAKELKAEGVDVLSFSVGEPDFPTPPHIREAAKTAIENGATRYTAASGLVELREAICEASFQRRQVRHTPGEVVVSVGAKHTLFNLALALYNPGDEVIIPAPYWVSYPEQVRLAGAHPVIVSTTEESGFKLTPDQLKEALTPQTKAVVLCSPSNPTGAAFSESEMKALIEVLSDHSCWIIVDEIYAELVYGDFQHHSILSLAPELRDRIIVVDGVSKTYAMTGWRIGWMLAPARVTKAVGTIQSQSTTNPASVSQHAAMAALRGPQDCVQEMREAFTSRRTQMVEGLRKIPGVTCNLPEGAFYAFPNMSSLIGKRGNGKILENDLDLAAYFLESAKCALVPGIPFGAPGHMRISYAVSNSQIDTGLARLGAAIGELK